MNISANQSILVLGGGSWGTALAILLANAGEREVKLWVRNHAHSEMIGHSNSNEAYLPGISFPKNLSIYSSGTLAQAGKEHSLFLLVVPSHAFRATTEMLKVSLESARRDLSTITVLWGTKGFDPQTNELLSKVAKNILGDQPTLGVVTGPSFAKETANGLPTALVLASEEQESANALAQLFKTASTRVYPSTDLVGAQLGGAVKNVIAVAAGISDGLGFGANARTALITRGLAELTRFGAVLGGKMETFMGLSGMGDLVLTCTDDQSRNRRLGLGVGKGQSAAAVIEEIGQEVEGFNTTKELHKKAKALGISMPITEQVYAVLHEGRNPKEAVQLLLNRKAVTEQ